MTLYSPEDQQLLDNIAQLIGPGYYDEGGNGSGNGGGNGNRVRPISLAALPDAESLRPTPQPEFGVSGTEFNFGGTIGAIIGGDYNRDLAGKEGLKKYDEMRRGDAGVRSILSIIKSPIIRAKPEIRLPKFPNDSLKEERSASEEMQQWLQWALLDDDAMQEDWDFYIRNQLLCVDFGFSVAEIIWQVDEDDRYRPLRLAPRLPRTIDKWIVGRSGQLLGVIQRAHDPLTGKMTDYTIPGDYLMVTTFDREGDNFQGFGLLRSAYKHYYYKDQLYHIDMVRLDRFGVGIPMAQLEEGFSTRYSELQKLEAILQGIRSSHKAYIISPPKAKISILTPGAGTGGGAEGIKTAIDHHDVMMARNALAHFMTMGAERHGSWSLGVSFIDLFMAGEEALAMNLGSGIKRRVIRPMCDLNFPIRTKSRDLPVKYPWMAFTDIGRVDIVALSDALSKLGAGGFITDDDQLEEFIRTKGNLPSLPADRTRKAREEAMEKAGLNPSIPPQLQVKPGIGPGQPPPGQSPANGNGNGRRPANAELSELSDVPLSLPSFGRPPTAFERTVLSLHEIPNRLDMEEEQLARKIAGVRLEQLNYLAQLAAQKDSRTSTAAHTDLRPDTIKLPARLASAIESIIRQHQDSMLKYGAQQVRLELVRQGAPVQLDDLDNLDVMMLLDRGATSNRLTARSHLVSSAKAATKRLNDQWIQKVMDLAIRLRRTGLTGTKLEREIVSVLSQEAAVNILSTAQEEIREAFGVGRGVEASAHADIIEKVVQSSVLDRNTCGPCESVDSEEMEMGSPRQVQLNPPYVLCKGREKCRCVQLYLYSGRRERSAIAASTNAPQSADTALIAAAIRESMLQLTGTLRSEVEAIVDPIRAQLAEVQARVNVEPRAPDPPAPINVTVPVQLANGRSVEFLRDGDGRISGYRELYSPGQPRRPKGDPHGGEWTDSGASGARAGAAGDDVFFASPSDAIVSLEAGRPVTIAREDLHNVLMRAKDSKVNDIDLTRLTIEDTALFAGGLNRPRSTMPQIPKEHRDQFIADLESRGYTVQKVSVSPTSLLPTQNEINAGRVGEKLARYEKGGDRRITAIFISDDDYVLDGHHRWAVMAAVDFISPRARVRQPAFRIKADRNAALALMDDYMKRHNIPRESLELSMLELRTAEDVDGDGDDSDWEPVIELYSPSQPRDPKGTPTGGRWTSGGGGILPGMAAEDQPPGTAGLNTTEATAAAVEEGRVVSQSSMDSDGVNQISRVIIEHEGQRIHAVWKPESGEAWDDSGLNSGNTESWGSGEPIRETIQNREFSLAAREAAAYEVSQVLGLNNVPPTSHRVHDGEAGMMQQFIHGGTPFADAGGNNQGRPIDHFNMGALDVVTGNTDRHLYNGLVDKSGKLWAIDHGYSFPSSNGEWRQEIVFAGYLRQHARDLDSHAREVVGRLRSYDWDKFARDKGMNRDEHAALMSRVQMLAAALDPVGGGGGAAGLARAINKLRRESGEHVAVD